jgi:hypothetical protein
MARQRLIVGEIGEVQGDGETHHPGNAMNKYPTLLDALSDILNDTLEMFEDICRFDVVYEDLQAFHSLQAPRRITDVSFLSLSSLHCLQLKWSEDGKPTSTLGRFPPLIALTTLVMPSSLRRAASEAEWRSPIQRLTSGRTRCMCARGIGGVTGLEEEGEGSGDSRNFMATGRGGGKDRGGGKKRARS